MSPDTPIYGWFGVNRAVFLWINGFHAPWWDTINAAITFMGSADRYPMWIALALVVSWRFPRHLPLRNAVSFSLGFVATGFLVPWLKAAAALPRPFVLLGQQSVTVVGQMPHSWSFPSGHSTFAFLIAATLSSDLPRSARIVLWCFAGLVALSRVVVGAHFPADVLGGAIVGVGVGWAVRKTIAFLRADSK